MQLWNTRYRSLMDAVEAVRGATAPNPPVGALIWGREGQTLTVAAHQQAGGPHAEILALQQCRNQGLWDEMEGIALTLEPCNHHGRTPPCTEALLESPIRKLAYLFRDPAPHATPLRGSQRLEIEGFEVRRIERTEMDSHLHFEHWLALAPFFKPPWITLKTVRRHEGSATTMIPPEGLKTFASSSSLVLAHQLRKRADAVITGSGTVLADEPLFTVRYINDHAIVPSLKKRVLVVLDRRQRVSKKYRQQAQARGWIWAESRTWDEALVELKARGVCEALVEAGPELSQFVLDENKWDLHVDIEVPELIGVPRELRHELSRDMQRDVVQVRLSEEAFNVYRNS